MECQLQACVRTLSNEMSEVSTFVVLRVVTKTGKGKSAQRAYFEKKTR